MFIKLNEESKVPLPNIDRVPWIVDSNLFLCSPSLGILLPKDVRINLLVDLATNGYNNLGETCTVNIATVTTTQDHNNRPVNFAFELPPNFGHAGNLSICKRLENVTGHWYTDTPYYALHFVVTGHTIPQDFDNYGNVRGTPRFHVELKASIEIAKEGDEWADSNALQSHLLKFKEEYADLLPVAEKRFIPLPKKTLGASVTAKDISDIF